MKRIKNIFNIKKYVIISTIIFVVFIAVFLFFSIRIEIDIALMFIGIALLGAVYIIYLITQYRIKPKKTIVIISSVEFKSPPLVLKPFSTYKLIIKTTHQIEEKGKVRREEMEELKMSFNKKDHPNIYNYCLELIQDETSKRLNRAKLMYPEAEIISTEINLPPSLLKIEKL